MEDLLSTSEQHRRTVMPGYLSRGSNEHDYSLKSTYDTWFHLSRLGTQSYVPDGYLTWVGRTECNVLGRYKGI